MQEAEARAILAEYDSSRYYRYAQLTAFLQAWAALYPGFCRLESLGCSPQGREIWQVTLTNQATGDDRAKPAYHINGQHHAGELTASAVPLYTVYYLLTHYGIDPAVTELLDTRTVYLLPRMAVDGAEWYLEHPQQLRSSPLLYPEPEEPEGLRPEDVNGDGKVLQMRIEHPDGGWRISQKDPRLMVRRRPEDREGQFYRLHTEGLIMKRTEAGYQAAYDGRAIGPDPGGPYARERAFDFNRNYPTNWQPQHRQPGSGRYPFDREEVRALARFWVEHPNIGAAMSYHTYSGMNLRPSPLVADEKLNPFDLRMYKLIGEACSRITGYPTVSVYDYFTMDYRPERLDVGSWLEWCYDERGVQGFEMELWAWPYITGVPKRPFKELKNLSDEQREEEALMQLLWNDRELGGAGFSLWQPFDHPQLGGVEIGGWDSKYVIQNVPPKLLQQECHKNCLFTIQHALALPRLEIGEIRVEQVAARCFKLAVQVNNRGLLPTHVTEVALQLKQSRPVRVSLEGECELAGGRREQELGQIPGRGSGGMAVWINPESPVTERWADWVLLADPGSQVTVRVTHDRGGSLQRRVTLGAASQEGVEQS